MIKPGSGVVVEGVEYLCFAEAEMDGRQYVSLITVEEPNEVCFAEQMEVDGGLKVRVVGEKREKERLLALCG